MFSIQEWGPGYRNEYTNGGRQPGVMVGAVAVLLVDPTGVLFQGGSARLVLRAIPDYGSTRRFRFQGGLHGTPTILGNGLGDRLTEYVMSSDEEVLRRFDALPVLPRPGLFREEEEKMDAWIYAGRTVMMFNPLEKLAPETRPFGPTLTAREYPKV